MGRCKSDFTEIHNVRHGGEWYRASTPLFFAYLDGLNIGLVFKYCYA